jgi:uncharacterized small protein (DUF1192 family)
LPRLVFPRLSRLSVSRYEPYVNADRDSFDHAFLPGVNVIVGINGLGKTTLLNVIFRLLVGPFDPAKADRDRPGRRQADLTRNKNFDFFRRRANDEAVEAKASATFRFGDRRVSITRSLHDLRLLEYAIDGHQTLIGDDGAESETGLMDDLARLMGFDVMNATARGSDSYRYDYDFVVRNLIFFLEDKIPLIWNPDGQFVILRILLVDEALSENIAKARNELLKADSQYRNRLWASNKLRDQISEQLTTLAELSAEAEAFHLVVSEVGALQQARDDLVEQRDFFSDEMERTENQLLQARADAFDAQIALRSEEAAYFQQAFRSIRTPGDLILQALESHEGCLVCGNRDEATYERARRLMDEHCCPVCEADTALGVEGVADYAEAQLGRLKAAERKANLARERVTHLEQASIELAQHYRRANEDLIQTSLHLDQAKRRERRAETQAEQVARVTELREQIAAIEEEVEGLKRSLAASVDHHEALIKQSQTFIEKRSTAIIEAFEEYASAFMVEDCRLRFRDDRRARVAQSDAPIDWPAFEVYLASGADAQPTLRTDWREVSESQKEFIDLAFRMALLRVASEGRASMLAVETPEASLDAFFVGKAGDLLREYAGADPDNVLLVSSNLTRERLIARLLGTVEGNEDVATRKARTLNLLEVARPTKAYRENANFYDTRFAEAIGEIPFGREEP